MEDMVGKTIKLAFQRIQQFVIWTSQVGVMTETLKTTLEANSRARLKDRKGDPEGGG